jgi:hexosaminidase
MITKKLLIPLQKYKRGAGQFRWPQKTVLETSRMIDVLPLKQLVEDLKRVCCTDTSIHFGVSASASLRIVRDHKIANSEGYRISIDPEEILVSASHDAGAFYATQTLRDMLTIYGHALPVCRIEDWPDFKRRGIFYDCSRGKVPKISTVKSLIRRLASWKINELQLYIENVFKFDRHPLIGKGFSPFSPEDILEIQDYCKLYHIQLVPTFASFGHMEKILAIPRYRHLSEGVGLVEDKYPGFLDHPGGTTICPGDPDSIKLVGELYEEYLPLFEAEDFNVCCDETWELGCGRSKNRANRVGVGRVYLDYILKIQKLCNKHGKRMNFFGDVLFEYKDIMDDVLKEAVLVHWEYEENGSRLLETKNICELGLPFLACPGTSGWLSHGTRLSNSMQNIKKFSVKGRKYGAEGMLTMDWGDFGHRNFLGVSLHAMAYGAAHSWNGGAVDDKRFTQTFCHSITGQSNEKLAEAICILGNTYLTVDPGLLYHSLLESLVPTRSYFKRINQISPMWIGKAARNIWINKTKISDLEKVISQLSDSRKWPKPKGIEDKFVALMFEELSAGAMMETLAAQRAIVATKIRAGKTISSGKLKTLSDRTTEVSEKFEKLWLTRNRPSRLRDNLVLFDEARCECLDLVDK